MAALAPATTTIEFATSVLVMPQRQAPLVAKQIATLDLLSGGRLNIAVGTGWNAVEYAGLGVDFADATAILDEQIDVLRALWTSPVVDFTGRFHTLRGVGLTPFPGIAKPIWMGTRGRDAALRRVVAKADGWMPLLAPGLDPIDVATAVTRLRQLATDAGRDPATLPVWGRVYLGGDGYERQVEQAKALGFSHLSVGFNRMAKPDSTHAEHLAAAIEAKPTIDAIVNGS